MEVKGLNIMTRASGVPGKPKNWAINYLYRARASYPQLRELPVTINRFGVTPLTLNPFYKFRPAAAEIRYKSNRDITLNYNKDINFKIQRIVLAARSDFVLSVQDGSGCLKRLIVLRENDPVIVSYLQADVARIAKNIELNLPERPIFALTYKGNNVFKVESLDDQRTIYVHMNLIRQPEITEGEFKAMVQKNALKLEKVMASPALRQAECFLFMTVSTRGEILAGTEGKEEDEGYFEFALILSPDRPLELIPQNMIEMLGNTVRVVRVSKEETGMPGIIKKLLLNSVATYNILSESRQN